MGHMVGELLSQRSKILQQAKELDQAFGNYVPEGMKRIPDELQKVQLDLRYFVQAFVTTQLLSSESNPEVTGSAKPKVQVGQLRELDFLTVQVTKAITTATAV